MILIPRDIRTIIGATQTRKDDHAILIPRGIRTINVRPRPLRIRIFVYETEKTQPNSFEILKLEPKQKTRKTETSVRFSPVRFGFAHPKV